MLDHVDIAYFPEGQTILALGVRPDHLLVSIKGFAQQWEGGHAGADGLRQKRFVESDERDGPITDVETLFFLSYERVFA